MTTDTHNKNQYEGKYHIMTQLTRIAQFDNLNRLCLKEPFAVINSDPHWASQFKMPPCPSHVQMGRPLPTIIKVCMSLPIHQAKRDACKMERDAQSAKAPGDSSAVCRSVYSSALSFCTSFQISGYWVFAVPLLNNWGGNMLRKNQKVYMNCETQVSLE